MAESVRLTKPRIRFESLAPVVNIKPHISPPSARKPAAASDYLPVLAVLVCAILFAAGSPDGQDSRAYEKGDVPLSHTLEARNASDAWKEVEKACNRFPRLTGETAGGFQRGDPRTAYHESWLVAAADKAQEFYTKYPADDHALSACEKELDILCQAFDETYATNQLARIYARATDLLRNPYVEKEKRLGFCNLVFMFALGKRQLLPATNDIPSALREDIQILEKDFPGRPEIPYFSELADDSKFERRRPLLRELSEPMPIVGYRLIPEVIHRQKELIGKPFEIQFSALGGRNINTTNWNGNVIAIVFWGLSYPVSTTNVIRLDRLYAKFHSQGFQAIGVNLDHEQEGMKEFLRISKVEWPHYWDGHELRNKIVGQAVVSRAGTVLLIDRHGLLRKYDGDEDLEAEVQKLMKE